MTLPRLLKWITSALLAAVMTLFQLVIFLDWNLLRPALAGWVSAATGRSFAINGDLSVKLA